MKLNTVLFLTGIILSVNSIAQVNIQEAVNTSGLITTEHFFQHLNVLASDSLEGRGIGTQGFEKAGNYVIGEIQKLGLQPLGNNGSYFQSVDFDSRKVETSSCMFSNGKENLTGIYGTDLTFLPLFKSPEINKNEEIVFIGYGLDIPELGINDFNGVDVKDKVVIVSLGFPKNFDKRKYSVYSNPVARINMLQKKGVSGIIFYTNFGALQNLIFKSVHNFFKSPYIDYKDADLHNQMLGINNTLIYSKKNLLKKIFTLEDKSYKKVTSSMEKGRFEPFKLKTTMSFKYKANSSELKSSNIVAVLPGSDPELSSQYIVLCAHLDHLGIGKPVKNDSIYNGAWDNASGSATLLSVAEAYKSMSTSPKRSIIFLWATGEEKGLLGSYYFAEKPTVPSSNIVANLSLDMPGGIFEAKNIIPMGYKMSNLSDAIDFATKNLNLVSDTLSPYETEYFDRSDHFSFVQAGIPALFIMGGMNAMDPKIDGNKTFKNWEKKTYHSPFDDMKQPLSSEAFLQGIRVHFLTSWFIANEMPVVKWKTDSEQYKRFIKK